MLSRGAMGFSHNGHFDGGRRIDSLAGTRTITTLRNDPIASPKNPRMTRNGAMGIGARAYGPPPGPTRLRAAPPRGDQGWTVERNFNREPRSSSTGASPNVDASGS